MGQEENELGVLRKFSRLFSSLVVCLHFVFLDSGLYSPDWPWTHRVTHSDLEPLILLSPPP